MENNFDCREIQENLLLKGDSIFFIHERNVRASCKTAAISKIVFDVDVLKKTLVKFV